MDVVLDAAVLIRCETSVRPEEKRRDAWLEAQRERIVQFLAQLESDCIAELQTCFDIVAVGIVCTLGYLDLRRLGWDRRSRYPRLAA